MPSADDVQALDELAEALGVTRAYHDGMGQWRRACDESVLAVVRALGAPVERIEDAHDAVREVRSAQSTARVPEVTVLAAGEGGDVPLPGCHWTHARLACESGETIALAIAPRADTSTTHVRVPQEIASGCHRLDVDDGHSLVQAHVMVTPRRLPAAPRSWGLFAPLYSLRTGNAQCGNFPTYGDLARLADWMVEAAPPGSGRDTAYLGTLPLLACFFEEPFEPSPYSPISRAFWSEIYVDPRATPEFDARTAAVAAAADHAGESIDYRRAMRERRAAIEALLRNLDTRGGRRRDDFDNVLEDDEELARYAAFRACVERYGNTWHEWPSRARDGVLRPGSEYDGEVFRYHAYAQWLAREQIAAAAAASPAGLYLDLPLGSHGGGYDTWRYRDDYVRGMSAGAPPDMVFEGGQDWGFPPLHPGRARQSCYASVRAALRHHFEHAALLRVDHVMSLHRLFWIPQGFTAADGVYVRSRSDELWSILSIEAARARGGAGAAVVGEDLGTVPDEVRAEMGSRGALRMFVVPFECRDDGGPALADPPEASLACLGTHDMEPFATWWTHESTRRDALAAFTRPDELAAFTRPDELAAFTRPDELTAFTRPDDPTAFTDATDDARDVLRALLAWLSASAANIVIANLEDFWLERRRQNLPGTEAADRNWKRPFARTFAEFAGDPEVQRLLRTTRGEPSRDGQAMAGGVR